jgi:DNA (cytosine-5)-methyltransferase 1
MIQFIDLFSGCGGLSEGFLQAEDYDGLAHIEWKKPMVETLRNRLIKRWGHTEEAAKQQVVHYDIMDINGLFNGPFKTEYKNNSIGNIENGIKSFLPQKIDLIIGGPPCQAYSIAGRAQDPNSMKNDYRNFLFEKFCAFVEEFNPKMFVFENVPGILSAAPGDIKVTSRILKAFKNIGYEILQPKQLEEFAVLNANDYGVPQARKRVIIVGIQENSGINLLEVYQSIYLQKSKSKPTVKAALDSLDKRYISNDIWSIPRKSNERDVQIFHDWIELNMNRKSMEEKMEFYAQRVGKSSNHVKYRSLEYDKPAPTVVAHLKKDGLMFIHPEKSLSRSITVREAAVLQSFPLDYEFIGSMGSAYEMIGNAVPVELAKKIAIALKPFLA